MDIHYNAFISYRHHPDDIRVASQIHRSLEQFHIPGPLRKRKKKISRIFRDKEELPITSDLNDDIDRALKNSEYLIVICSVHTKESIWVQREIDLFLQTHDRNHVLTVLASGEPYDVIPENLLFEDVQDPETGEITRIAHEPLSCDWRMSLRKAKQEELPRLAAALLGCGYDELRQRQKQFRTRRATAVIAASFAALLGLSAYFLHTSITIQKANEQIEANLQEALLNQSQYLVTAANEMLSKGDRFTAIALSAAALPSEDNPRPYLPAAERALISALDLYITAEGDFAAAGVFALDEGLTIDQFWTSDDKKTMYIVDNRDVLTCWDTETYSRKNSFSLMEMKVLFTTPEGNFICRSEDSYRICALDPQGNRLWESVKCLQWVRASDSKALMVLDFDEQLHFISTATGEAVRRTVALGGEDTDTQTVKPAMYGIEQYDPQLPIPVKFSVETKDAATGKTVTTYSISLLNPGEDSVKPVVAGLQSVEQIICTPDGKLLFTADSWSEATMTGRFGDNRINGPVHTRLYCYQAATTEQLWDTVVTYYSGAGEAALCPIPESNRVLCLAGQYLCVFDTDTGEVVSNCETGSPVVTIRVEADKAWAILQDGYLCAFVYDKHYCYEQKCLAGPLFEAAIGKDFYGYALGSSRIMAYRPREKNPDWEYPMEDYILDPFYVGRNVIAYVNYDTLYLVDLQTRTRICEETYTDLQLLGFSNDKTKLWCLITEEDTQVLLEVDPTTGTAQKTALPVQEDVFYAGVQNGFCAFNDTLSYLDINESTVVFFFDLKEKTVKASLPLDSIVDHNQSYNCSVIAQTEQCAWLWVNDGQLLEVDIATGEAVTLCEELEQKPKIILGEDGVTAVIATLDTVYIRKPGTTDNTQWTFSNAKIGSICSYGDELLLLCDDGYLYRCDGSGNILSQTQLECDEWFAGDLTSAYMPPVITWDFTDNNRLVMTACSVANVIDCEQWALCNAVTDCVAYRTDNGSFICSSGTTLSGYSTYTVEELLQMAQQQLQNFALTQAQKAAYGID